MVTCGGVVLLSLFYLDQLHQSKTCGGLFLLSLSILDHMPVNNTCRRLFLLFVLDPMPVNNTCKSLILLSLYIVNLLYMQRYIFTFTFSIDAQNWCMQGCIFTVHRNFRSTCTINYTKELPLAQVNMNLTFFLKSKYCSS